MTARARRPAPPAPRPWVAKGVREGACSVLVGKRAWPGGLREHILARDEHRCRKCRRTKGLEVHHIREVSDGGMHAAWNLVTLCGSCHDEQTVFGGWSIPFETWLAIPPAGLLVRLWLQDPSDPAALAYKLSIEGHWARFVAGELEAPGVDL